MRNQDEGKKEVQVLTKEKFDFQQLLQTPPAELAVVGQSVTRTDAAQRSRGN